MFYQEIGRQGPQSVFQVPGHPGPVLTVEMLGWGWWVSHVGGCLLLHPSLPSFLSLLNTAWGDLGFLQPLLLNPLFALSPLDLGLGCVLTS